jgi:hypothetical protein
MFNYNLIRRLQFNYLSTLILSDQTPFKKSSYYSTVDYLTDYQLSMLLNNWDLHKKEQYIIQSKGFDLNFPIFIFNKNPRDEINAKNTLIQYLNLLEGFCDTSERKFNEVKCLLVLDTEDGLKNSPLWKAVIDRFTENGTKSWGKEKKILSIDIFSTINPE